jgi:hypothetical protein
VKIKVNVNVNELYCEKEINIYYIVIKIKVFDNLIQYNRIKKKEIEKVLFSRFLVEEETIMSSSLSNLK